jgi:hypothetical protein
LSRQKENVQEKVTHLPFGSAGRFNQWRHTITEQILVLAEVNDIEDYSLENNKTKPLTFHRSFA